MFRVLMPRLDAGMKEGTIIEWLKKEGESIQKGDPLVKIEGEKVVFDVEAQTSGLLNEILAKQGTTVSVGEAIAVVKEDREIVKEEEKPMEMVPHERTMATPAAKRIAKERRLDLSKIKGSGPNGMILERDLLGKTHTANIEASGIMQITDLEIAEVIPLTGMRKTIAERMTHSYRTAPHVAITMEVNMSRPLGFMHETLETTGVRVPMTALLTYVTARALKENSIMNSILEDDQIKIVKNVNIGIAVSLEEGLVVPVLRDAEKKDVLETAQLIRHLIEKAKARTLSAEELGGGTFTITNLGSFDVDTFTPIINPPQTAIMGIGRISEKPVVVETEIKTAPLMTLTLVFDHRVLDGATAAMFLKKIKQSLEAFQ